EPQEAPDANGSDDSDARDAHSGALDPKDDDAPAQGDESLEGDALERAQRGRIASDPADRETSLAECARVAGAIERGDIEHALAEYSLDRDELGRIQAYWKARAGTDPKLATYLAEAIEAARWE